ncbi:MAG: hypothetical protein V7L01_33080 [Nostoc sp.]
MREAHRQKTFSGTVMPTAVGKIIYTGRYGINAGNVMDTEL